MTFQDEIKVMRTTEGLFSAGQIYKIQNMGLYSGGRISKIANNLMEDCQSPSSGCTNTPQGGG